MFKEKVRVQILEGKLTDKGKCLCGSYRGYEIMVNQMNGFYQICMNAHSDECEDACIWFKVSGSDQ